MHGIRPYLPLIAEALPIAVLMLIAWRELRVLERLRREREASERTERTAAALPDAQTVRPPPPQRMP